MLLLKCAPKLNCQYFQKFMHSRSPKYQRLRKKENEKMKYQPSSENIILDNILQRKYPIKQPNKEWAQGKYPTFALGEDDLSHAWETVEPCENNTISMVTKVILLENVEGLGGKDDVVQVHISKFLRYLFPLKLAILATPENRNKFNNLSKGNTENVYKLKIELENIILPVIVNPDSKWTIDIKHIYLALKYSDICVKSMDQIKLPEEKISYDNNPEQFDISIIINNHLKAQVTCEINYLEYLDNMKIVRPILKYKGELDFEEWTEPLKDRPKKIQFL